MKFIYNMQECKDYLFGIVPIFECLHIFFRDQYVSEYPEELPTMPMGESSYGLIMQKKPRGTITEFINEATYNTVF